MLSELVEGDLTLKIPGPISNRQGGIAYNGGIKPVTGQHNGTMACKTADGCRGNRRTWAIHNTMMWLCWTVFMCVVISSARYFRQYWRKSIYIHTSIGITILVVTVTASLMAWGNRYVRFGYFMQWSKLASMMENIGSFYATALCLSGMVAWFTRRYATYEWNTTKVLNAGRFHKWFSYTFCFFSQGLIMFAIMDNFAY